MAVTSTIAYIGRTSATSVKQYNRHLPIPPHNPDHSLLVIIIIIITTTRLSSAFLQSVAFATCCGFSACSVELW